ncbi:MAG: Gfo/Idh/MocA family protein, partial [Bacteroidota bacterium]
MNDSFRSDRRTFLRRMSALAGSSVALTAMPWLSVFGDSYASGRAPSDRVRLGVIGVGDRGNALALHIKELEKVANVQLAAVCDNYDPHYERAIETAGPGVRAFKDHRELLEMNDLDGVLIATPLHEHAHITVDCYEAGLHVFCEKAMARTIPDVRRMYDAHVESGNIMIIGHQRLFNPIYLEAMERIRRGGLGPITQMRAYWHRNNDWRREVPPGRPDLERKINWRMYTEYSAGLLTELGSHHFQVANWVKDSQPVSVVAKGAINYWKDGREVYDNVACIFMYPDDMPLIYDSMISNKHYGLQVQVMG